MDMKSDEQAPEERPQGKEQPTGSPSNDPAAAPTEAVSPIASGSPSPAPPHKAGHHSRAHGVKSPSRNAAAAASEAATPIAGAAVSPGRQIRRAVGKQQSLSPKKLGSPASVSSSPGSPAHKPSAKEGKGRRAATSHGKGAARDGPGEDPAARGVPSVPSGTKGNTTATKEASGAGKADAASPTAKNQDPPRPEAAQAGPTPQKAVATSIIGMSTAMWDGKRNKIAITLACFGTILVASSLIIYVVSSSGQKSLPLCSTEDCRKHAKLLTDNIDWTLDPCEDFSAFVCSAARNSSGPGSSKVAVMNSFVQSWYGQFHSMLRDGAEKIPAGKKALAMYEKCLHYASDKAQPKLFLDFLASQGLSWPELPAQLPSPLNYILKVSYKWQAPLWITVNLFKSTNQSSRGRRVLLYPGFHIPDMWSNHKKATSSYGYTHYWDQYRKRLYPDRASRPRLNESAVDEIIAVEKDVLERLNAVFTSKAPEPATFSFGNLEDHVPNVSNSVWRQSFQSALLLEPELSLDDTIVVSDVNLLKTIAKLISTYDRRQLNMHLTWLLVQYYAPISDYRLFVDFYGNDTEIAAAWLPMYCARHVEAPYRVLILALSLVSRFTAADRKIIDDGFHGLVSATVDNVQKSSWMDPPSKDHISKKLLAAKMAVWPPDDLLKEGVLDSIYFAFPGKDASLAEYWIDSRRTMLLMNTTEGYEEAERLPWNTPLSYASYDYALNTVKIAMSVIAEPAYYAHGSKAMLHGGLLFLLATALARAIDNEGLQWTSVGTKVSSIVTASTQREFKQKDACLSHLGKSRRPEVPASAMSFAALRQAHIRDGSVPLALNKRLTEDKVFFMTLCYLTCRSSGDRDPLGLDCNKVAQNSEAFGKAFNCSKGSKMNPDEKCLFF
ncbi:neprilysin-like isoform X2 [Dermacentor variabilis]|uniref:neprilysin-like isoform X2 n=1 Tax=Dermacentor variabilis TaxID=34621 RepID=UPI003F5AE78C